MHNEKFLAELFEQEVRIQQRAAKQLNDKDLLENIRWWTHSPRAKYQGDSLRDAILKVNIDEAKTRGILN